MSLRVLGLSFLCIKYASARVEFLFSADPRKRACGRKVMGRPRVETTPQGEVVVFPMRVNVNLKSLTVEQVPARINHLICVTKGLSRGRKTDTRRRTGAI